MTSSPSEFSANALEEYCPPQLKKSVETLLPLLYEDLKRLARSQQRKFLAINPATTTGLVHDAYERLRRVPAFASHTEFLKVAAVTMRHLLVDRARAQMSQKRGGDQQRVDLDTIQDFAVEECETVVEIHDALKKLAVVSPRLSEIVECRYFGGYSEKEIAEALGVTERTVQREWVLARSWLARELSQHSAGGLADA